MQLALFLRWLLLFFLGLCLSFNLALAFRADASTRTSSSVIRVQSHTSVVPSPHELVQAGKASYDDQRYVDANGQLSQAVYAYSQQGNLLQQAQALALQSLSLQKLGDWERAKRVMDESISLITTLPNPSLRIRAQIFNAQGHLQFATGQAADALTSWEQAEQDYVAATEPFGAIGSQINQLQVLESLGLYHRADQRLAQLEGQLTALPDDALKVSALLSLGKLLRVQGDVVRAQERLTAGLAIAQALPSSPMTMQLKGKLYLSFGNVERLTADRAIALNTVTIARPHIQLSLDYYQQAAATASLLLTQVEAQLNQLSLLIQIQTSWQQTDFTESRALISTVAQTLSQLTPSRGSVYAQINFACSLMKLDSTQLDASLRSLVETSVPHILAQATEQATVLADERAISYALGTLGSWYETQQDWQAAKELTATALQRSQSILAADVAYQWQWQMGRIIQAESENSNAAPAAAAAEPIAIRYYTESVKTLDTLRADLVALNPDAQFSFRDQVEPVYRELVDLLLREKTASQETLAQALDVIESLQLAELDNFFRNACAQPQSVTVSSIDPTAALLYPILLRDRLEVILQLPETRETTNSKRDELTPSYRPRLVHVGHAYAEADVVEAATDLQRDLRVASVPTSQIKAKAEQLYGWMIRPFEDELDAASQREDSPVKTLTFVLDGPLRNLPMAALYDGEHYLVERYAVAVTPGLQLLNPQQLKRQPLNVLLGGAVNAPSFENFALSPLVNVDRELEDIGVTVADTQRLTNQAFLQRNLQKEIESSAFNVVHLATHGKFSSNPEQTFILDWEKPILAKDIDNLLFIADPQRAAENPIELLVLSACETASGDSRAALGLAGIALRAGARSTLASLWQVNDASTAEFMVQFYQELSNSQVTKAEALRNVQLSFLAADSSTYYARPNRWAPFILVGNWL